MTGIVQFSKKAEKQINKLPQKVMKSLDLLVKDIREYGPFAGSWPNYGKLAANLYHCHLCKRKPIYVVIWRIVNKHYKFVEVIYVGTHENAPY